jgi:MFS transporter, DHA1 family, solute carrier family 18 (vesicular amine transporter), member 1/2
MGPRPLALVLVTLATFTDIVAYSICVPVLPDFAHRLGASPTVIGLLFASFGVTLLAVSAPMGAVSDRVGRKGPLAVGMLILAGATVLFARADSLGWLFAARMLQGAADAVTWVVGFALIADRYRPDERGRVMGYVMSGTSLGIMLGPSIGGWLYEAGGVALPFECTAALALVCAVGFAVMPSGMRATATASPSVWTVARVPTVALCAVAVVATGATIAMLEPVLPMFFTRSLGFTPSQIGWLFGGAAVSSIVMPFVWGPLTDRWGGRRLTFLGLALTAAWLPVMATASSFKTAMFLMIVQWIAIGLIVTPSLAYMAETTSSIGGDVYGVGYGIYNTAWGVGILGGPALGGWLFERSSFGSLTIGWALTLLLVTLGLSRVQFQR